MWERKCMKYFDNNPSVIKWSSEELEQYHTMIVYRKESVIIILTF